MSVQGGTVLASTGIAVARIPLPSLVTTGVNACHVPVFCHRHAPVKLDKAMSRSTVLNTTGTGTVPVVPFHDAKVSFLGERMVKRGASLLIYTPTVDDPECPRSSTMVIEKL